MRKITDFIIKRRYIIITIFIILSVISIFVSQKVKINYDMTEYMPSDSETNLGLDIMEKEFEEEDISILNVMFKNLTDDEKTEIYEKLSNINGVANVDYEINNEEYNKGENTLYILNVNEPEDSETAKYVYDFVQENFKKYEFYTSGSIATRNIDILPIWIIILAVFICTVILIIMCESYVEPFLFLICIGIAVLLNNGTNIIFGTISNITSSISAILQLALSMDYSIMLINRYKQEKQKNADKIEAMKEALYKSFTSISSSSITTIVGLLTLVFMSFTIGRDIGLVLAKGVLLSLLVIFTCLPALILLFDKAITKTTKKSPNINLTCLGKFIYKYRSVVFILFIALFIVSYVSKGNLGILYTASELDKVGEVFAENNQMAIIYKNSDEEAFSQYLEELENTQNVDEVIAYGNTIGEKLKYNEVNNKLEELNVDSEIEDYLLKILYYNYYNSDINNKITFNEFVDFTKNNVLNNENISSKINQNIKDSIETLEKFTSIEEMNKKRNYKEIASILEIDENDCYNLFVYYYSDKVDINLTLNEFVKFINNEVLTDETYSNNIPLQAREDIKTISRFLDKNTIQKSMNSNEMANLFGIDETQVKNLYLYYNIINGTNNKMSINEFSNYIVNEILENPNYSNMINNELIENIKLLQIMSNNYIINTEMTSEEISNLFGIDQQLVSQIILLRNSMLIDNNTDITQTISPYEFVKFIIENIEDERISSNITEIELNQLKTVYSIMESSNNEISYTYSEMASFIGINEETTKTLYALYDFNNTELKLTPVTFVNFILEYKDDDMLKNNIDLQTVNDLKLINSIMVSTLNNQKYTAQEMAKLLDLNSDDLKLLYSLYYTKHIDSNIQVALNEFIDFTLNKVVTNEKYSNNFDDNKILKLNTINNIMNSVVNKTEYDSDEMFMNLSNLTDNIDKDTIEILYIYYGSEKSYNENWNLTIEEIINYANNDILEDSRFNNFIDEKMRNQIIDAKSDIQENKKMLIGNEYSRIVLNTKFKSEGKETFEFLQKIYDNFNGKELYIIGDSPMAYEMSKTFENEFNKISVISMLAIFIVVAITFKSIGIPLALVLIIQCAVYMTMGILGLLGGEIYFIAILIVQSILMGATIDYAILYTSYYKESRQTMGIKEAVINSYNMSINTILTSSLILIIATFIVGKFASAIVAKICSTLSQGVLCSTILILIVLPAVLSVLDKLIVKKSNKKIIN